MENEKLIISFDWHSYPSRDREIITPVINYLKYNGFEVLSANIFDYKKILNLHSPKYALFTNVVGAKINYSVAKYLRLKNIKVITLISEGYRQKLTDRMFIPPYSNCKIDFVDRLMVWNKKTLKYLQDNHPDIRERTKLTGNPGIDRFFLTPISSNPKFQRLVLNDYDLIITIGLFNWFHIINPKKNHKSEDNLLPLEKESRFKFNELVSEIIKTFPNYLFILRRHPGSTEIDYYDGIEGLNQYSNVLIIKNELSLLENIDISNYWFSYDSTTALEAILRGKKAANIRPVFIPNEFRTISNEVINTITDLAEFESFTSKDNKENHTKKYELVYFFGNVDGLNHVRVGNEIIRFLNNSSNQEFDNEVSFKLAFSESLLLLRVSVLSYLSPYLPKFLKRKSYVLSKLLDWNQQTLANFEKLRFSEQVQYYERLGYTQQSLRKLK
jgi:hypothetical protein